MEGKWAKNINYRFADRNSGRSIKIQKMLAFTINQRNTN